MINFLVGLFYFLFAGLVLLFESLLFIFVCIGSLCFGIKEFFIKYIWNNDRLE